MKAVLALLLVCVLAHLASVQAAPGAPANDKCLTIYCLAYWTWCPRGKTVSNNGHCCTSCPASNGNSGNEVGRCPSYYSGPYFPRIGVIIAPCNKLVPHEYCENHGECAKDGQRCCRTSCGMECVDADIHECKAGAQNTFFDGCNWCKCDGNGRAACTEKACAEAVPTIDL